jgi:hypothetical protein
MIILDYDYCDRLKINGFSKPTCNTVVVGAYNPLTIFSNAVGHIAA